MLNRVGTSGRLAWLGATAAEFSGRAPPNVEDTAAHAAAVAALRDDRTVHQATTGLVPVEP
jgi:hypothetical protein